MGRRLKHGVYCYPKDLGGLMWKVSSSLLFF